MAIAVVLKIKDHVIRDSLNAEVGISSTETQIESTADINQLATWLVFGTALVLLQEPHVMRTCSGHSYQWAVMTRRTQAILDPIIFNVLYESLARIGSLLSDSNKDEGLWTAIPLFSNRRQLENQNGFHSAGRQRFLDIKNTQSQHGLDWTRSKSENGCQGAESCLSPSCTRCLKGPSTMA